MTDDMEFVKSEIKRIWVFYELCFETVKMLTESLKDRETVFDALIDAMDTLDQMFFDLLSSLEKEEGVVQ